MNATLFTGGGDKPYALALAAALVKAGIRLDFIGSDEVASPDLVADPNVNFLNLRGDQSTRAPVVRKCWRIISYYLKLIRYAATARPEIFHILWNNKFEYLDRTLLLSFYRLLGKKLFFTAHNVNAGKRDGTDSWMNRLTLRYQYRTMDRIFVHTEKMKRELEEEFGVRTEKIVQVPFGINTTVPNTALSTNDARNRLGFGGDQRVLLFFGHIAPYKGLEYLLDAMEELSKKEKSYRLLIGGKPKNCEFYWKRIERRLNSYAMRDRIILNAGYIPDDQVELYFKAADVLVLPYTFIFQSGVLLLSYSFGLPVIASDVGSLREDVVEGRTGFVFRAKDSGHLATVIEDFFHSEIHKSADRFRQAIRQYAGDRYSWSKVGMLTHEAYASVVISNEKISKPL